MKYLFVPMTDEYAWQILNWKYDGEYSQYDYVNEADYLMNKAAWGKKLFVVLDDRNRLVGEFSLGFMENTDDWDAEIESDISKNENCMLWIGFGLRPDLTGKGLGLSFVEACTQYAVQTARAQFGYRGEWVGLGVFQFNQRAIKVYERLGFVKYAELMVEDCGKTLPAQNMRKRIWK